MNGHCEGRGELLQLLVAALLGCVSSCYCRYFAVLLLGRMTLSDTIFVGGIQTWPSTWGPEILNSGLAKMSRTAASESMSSHLFDRTLVEDSEPWMGICPIICWDRFHQVTASLVAEGVVSWPLLLGMWVGTAVTSLIVFFFHIIKYIYFPVLF